jgi:hypothetical protein
MKLIDSVVWNTTHDGKKMDLKVDDDTKIVGPHGGVSKERLKDERLAPGAEIKVTMDGKKVKQIQLLIWRNCHGQRRE